MGHQVTEGLMGINLLCQWRLHGCMLDFIHLLTVSVAVVREPTIYVYIWFFRVFSVFCVDILWLPTQYSEGDQNLIWAALKQWIPMSYNSAATCLSILFISQLAGHLSEWGTYWQDCRSYQRSLDKASIRHSSPQRKLLTKFSWQRNVKEKQATITDYWSI